MNFEILAPAGSRDALIAGVRSGANAVYLGGKAFNARCNAGNFDEKELNNAVSYCHQRNVKVYLTANTLVDDGEFRDAYNLIKSTLTAGVDAFIVQDIGLAKMIKSCFPTAKLHASTQTSVMTVEGVKKLQEIGFSRVVLPREMTFDEIKEISENTDVELEIFVHGALCMSVSGQCYMSAMLGSRSGNRGRCAQPCRLPFSADNSGSHDLSLKDLSLIEHLNELDELGVVSLKIEGRMKRPEYVSASVSACKKAINNQYTSIDKIKLRSVFSRSGFTDGYFTNHRGFDMFGTREKEDVISAKDVLSDFSHEYDNENPLIPIDLYFTCIKDEEISLSASALNKSVFIKSSAIPEVAINKPLEIDGVKARLSKLGGTPFFANDIEVDLDDGLIVSASAINELRRNAVEELLFEIEGKVKDFQIKELVEVQKDTKKRTPFFTARFKHANQIPKNHPFKRVFLPIWEKNEFFVKHSAGVEIPRGMFGKENDIKTRLLELKEMGVKNALCGNIGSYALAKKLGFNVYGDYSLNVFNSYSGIENTILSFELSLEKISRINISGEKGIIAYGKLPLMLTRNCPIKQNIGCDRCKKHGTLTDRKGINFPVVCSPYPCVEILNSYPLYMADRLAEINTDFIDFYFTNECEREVEEVINAYKQKLKPNGEFTRGLYYRGVE